LLDNITALSAPGSRLIAENMSGREGAATAMQDRVHETVDQWRAHGFDVEMTDLWYLGDRHDVADYLNARGWKIDQFTMAELFAEYGQTLAGSADETADFGSFTYVTAIRN
jgi:O-methyltransferase involved in polyketide biosynthesis